MAHVVRSTIRQLMVHREGCNVLLEEPEFKPKDGVFNIPKTHENYDSLYACALAAAVNKIGVTIRTEGEIVETAEAEVGYMRLHCG